MGPRGMVQQNGGLILTERCILDRTPLDEGPKPRRNTVKHLLHDIILEGDNSTLNQEIKLKGELMFWRTILEGRVKFKGSIYLKLLQIAPYVLAPWTPLHHLKHLLRPFGTTLL